MELVPQRPQGNMVLSRFQPFGPTLGVCSKRAPEAIGFWGDSKLDLDLVSLASLASLGGDYKSILNGRDIGINQVCHGVCR
jgi:hypothetical protein